MIVKLILITDDLFCLAMLSIDDELCLVVMFCCQSTVYCPCAVYN